MRVSDICTILPTPATDQPWGLESGRVWGGLRDHGRFWGSLLHPVTELELLRQALSEARTVSLTEQRPRPRYCHTRCAGPDLHSHPQFPRERGSPFHTTPNQTSLLVKIRTTPTEKRQTADTEPREGRREPLARTHLRRPPRAAAGHPGAGGDPMLGLGLGALGLGVSRCSGGRESPRVPPV